MPWQAIGRVQTELGGRCTGFMIAPRMMVTAAHCLFLPEVARFIRPRDVHFLLALDGDEQYEAHAWAVAFVVTAGYDPRREAQTMSRDRAFVTLDHDILPARDALHIARSLPPPGTKLMLGGYSQDRQERLSADLDCTRLPGGNGLIRHDCRAVPGVSGAPLLARTGQGWRVIGIQIASVMGGRSGFAAPLSP